MSKVRNSKADATVAQKSGSNHQENSKNSQHTPSDESKSGMQVEGHEPEVKQTASPTKETKSKATKASKRNAETEKRNAEAEKRNAEAEKRENAENGVCKGKAKKTENGEKSDCNNGLTTDAGLKEDSDEEIKLQMEEEQLEDSAKSESQDAKAKANGREKGGESASKEKEPEEKGTTNKGAEDKKGWDQSEETVILNDSQKLDETADANDEELANGEPSAAEQSYMNMSFGRTLRKISARRSISRLNDGNASLNSSLFVNTSMMSSFNDETFESKLAQYRSNSQKRKAERSSPYSKRIKSEPESGYSFSPYGFFQNLRRPVESKLATETEAPLQSKSRCLIM